MEWPYPEIGQFLQRPKFPGESWKLRKKSDFCRVSGSEIRKFRVRQNEIPYPQPFHAPTGLHPTRCFTLQGVLALPRTPPKWCDNPPWYLVSQARLCDTPFCNISLVICVMRHKNKHKTVLRCYRYKYRAVFKSIAAGPR